MWPPSAPGAPRGGTAPELLLGLAALLAALTGGVDAGRALGTAWGLQAGANAAAWEVMMGGADAYQAALAAGQDAAGRSPLFSGTGLGFAFDPPDPGRWVFGARVCVRARADWASSSPVLPALTRTLSAERCVYVQRWP